MSIFGTQEFFGVDYLAYEHFVSKMSCLFFGSYAMSKFLTRVINEHIIAMVRKLFLMSSVGLLALASYAQTLYVPSGISGIGSSTSGNVGIGVPAPLEKLHISGAIRGSSTGGALTIKTASGYIDIGPQSTSAAHIYTDRNYFLFNKPVYSANGQFCAALTYPLQFQTSNTTRMTVTNSGYVGVGCDPGTTTFKVYKAERPTFVLANSVSRLEIGVATSGYDYAPGSKIGDVVFRPLGHADNHNGLIICMPNTDKDGNSYIKFGDDGNALWMGIFNNKTVRIDGTLYATKIYVKSNVWADDVFKKDYNLLTLDEIRNYINSNGHLPGVPSQEYIIANGVDVSEMTSHLLRKIEELTLLIIKQDEKINSLMQEHMSLKMNK
jgi:hypothetical protein